MGQVHLFDPGSIDTFRILDWDLDAASWTVRLRYVLGDRLRFEEAVTFESVPGRPGVAELAGFARAVDQLAVAAGVSYYKAAAPPTVVVESTALTAAAAEVHRSLYDEGLREFAVSNGLPVPRRVTWEHRTAPAGRRPTGTSGPGSTGTTTAAGPQLAVPIGGGKDSMVLIEALRPLAPRLFAVNPHPLVRSLADEAGLELLVVRRRLDPALLALNAEGALNGHVPITAVVSLIALAGAFLHGYDTVAMAVERSASEETVQVDGVAVNHQFSKSLDFERALRGLVADSIDPSLVYGSALRPYSELAIARAFAGLDRYRSTFCSCNSVFRRTAEPADRWCGDCPKCRFVGLMLAPFLSPGELADVIGRDLFAEPSQTAGFAALMSDDDKPFECVGERRESAAALVLLADSPQWADHPVVAALADRARAAVSPQDLAELLAPDRSLDFPSPVVADAVAALLDPHGPWGVR
jgi:hypothetical protein